MRIPRVHDLTLSYCELFGLELRPLVMTIGLIRYAPGSVMPWAQAGTLASICAASSTSLLE